MVNPQCAVLTSPYTGWSNPLFSASCIVLKSQVCLVDMPIPWDTLHLPTSGGCGSKCCLKKRKTQRIWFEMIHAEPESPGALALLHKPPPLGIPGSVTVEGSCRNNWFICLASAKQNSLKTRWEMEVMNDHVHGVNKPNHKSVKMGEDQPKTGLWWSQMPETSINYPKCGLLAFQFLYFINQK